MDQLLPLDHPDMIRKLLPRLHKAAEAHRFVHEQIHATSRNIGSMLGKEVCYNTKIMLLARAIDALLSEQEVIRAQADDLKEDLAIADLIRPVVRRFPKCDEQGN